MTRAWAVVAVGFLGMIAGTAVGPAAFAVFLVPMSEDLGWRRDLLTGGLAAGTLAGAAVAPWIGRLVDQHGARVMLTLGGVGLGISMLGIAATPREAPWVFYAAYGLGRAIDMAVILLGTTVAVSSWFGPARRGRALGLVLAGNAAGVALLVPLSQWIIDVAGWRTAWVVIGLGAVAILTPAAWLVVRRAPEGASASPDQPELEPATVRQAVRTRAFWLLLVSSAIGQLVYAAAGTHQIAVMREHGLAAQTAAWVVSAFAVAWAVGEIAWGVVSERVPTRGGLTAVYGALTLAILTLLVATSLPAALAYGVVLGLALAGHEVMEAVAWAAYFGTRSLGAIRGLGRPMLLAGNAAGPVIVGMAYESTGSYGPAIGGLALLGVVAAVLAAALRPPVLVRASPMPRDP